jgi:hypothetical protein
MTKATDHDLTEAFERVKLVEQAVASIDQEIARIDAPETKIIKVKVGRAENASTACGRASLAGLNRHAMVPTSPPAKRSDRPGRTFATDEGDRARPMSRRA